MDSKLSQRLAGIIDALPLKDGIRILEIGCGPGAMARAISGRIKEGYILAIDRSGKAIRQALAGSGEEMETGKLAFRQCAIEKFEPGPSEKPFDIAIAVRVGALDGRHPEIEQQALANIAKALTKNGKLFIDGGNPLKEIPLDKYRQGKQAGNL